MLLPFLVVLALATPSFELVCRIGQIIGNSVNVHNANCDTTKYDICSQSVYDVEFNGSRVIWSGFGCDISIKCPTPSTSELSKMDKVYCKDQTVELSDTVLNKLRDQYINTSIAVHRVFVCCGEGIL